MKYISFFYHESQTVQIFVMKKYIDMTGTWKAKASYDLSASQFGMSQSTCRNANMLDLMLKAQGFFSDSS